MFEDKKERNLALYKKHKIPFIKMIEYLLPPSLELEGCEVIFPHSAFFGDEGKPAFICQTDQDGKLVSITQQNKLALQEIRQSFSGFVRKRKEQTVTFLQKLSKNVEGDNQSPATQKESKKQSVFSNLARTTIGGKSTGSSNIGGGETGQT